MPVSSSESQGYDLVTVHGEDGTKRSMNRQQYEKLALSERIRLILQNRVEFYRGGKLVSAKEALKVT
jgi:hypothetical protein